MKNLLDGINGVDPEGVGVGEPIRKGSCWLIRLKFINSAH